MKKLGLLAIMSVLLAFGAVASANPMVITSKYKVKVDSSKGLINLELPDDSDGFETVHWLNWDALLAPGRPVLFIVTVKCSSSGSMLAIRSFKEDIAKLKSRQGASSSSVIATGAAARNLLRSIDSDWPSISQACTAEFKESHADERVDRIQQKIEALDEPLEGFSIRYLAPHKRGVFFEWGPLKLLEQPASIEIKF